MMHMANCARDGASGMCLSSLYLLRQAPFPNICFAAFYCIRRCRQERFQPVSYGLVMTQHALLCQEGIRRSKALLVRHYMSHPLSLDRGYTGVKYSVKRDIVPQLRIPSLNKVRAVSLGVSQVSQPESGDFP